MEKSLVTFALLMFMLGSAIAPYGNPPYSGVPNYGNGPQNSGPPQYGNGPPSSGVPPYGAGPQNSGVPQYGAGPPNPVAQASIQTQAWIEYHRNRQEWNSLSYIYWTIPNEPEKMTPTIMPLVTNPGLPNEPFEANSQATRIWSILNPVSQGSKEYADERTKAARIITAINSDQRKQIADVFKNTPAQQRKREKERLSLDIFFEKKYMLNSEKFMRRIAKDPAKLDAYYLHEALTGKKDWKDVNEYATTRSNKQYEKLNQEYGMEYGGKRLRDAIESATGGAAKSVSKRLGKLTGATKTANPYQDLLLRIFDGLRDEYNLYEGKRAFSNYYGYTQYNPPRANVVAADVGRLAETADSDVYSEILGERSLGHIRAIMSDLLNKGMNLEGMIERNFRKEENYKNLLLTIIKVATNMPGFFAERYKKAMDQSENGLFSGAINNLKNGGLNDDDFQRYVATRSQVDQGAISEEFLKMYKVSLLDKACQEDEITKRPEYLVGVIAMLIGNDPVTGYTENYDRNKLPASCKAKL